jgi:hypothetical protein
MNCLEIKDPKHSAQIAQQHKHLILRDFWHVNLKALKEGTEFGIANVPQILKACLTEFEVADSFRQEIADLSAIYTWLFSAPKKLEDLMKTGQKITS